jgi:hypothetical protein
MFDIVGRPAKVSTRLYGELSGVVTAVEARADGTLLELLTDDGTRWQLSVKGPLRCG